MGRRTKLTPEVHNDIVAYIRQGAYDWVAAQACGINPATFYRWMAAGRRGSPLYHEFCQDVEKARCEARVIAENKVYSERPLEWLRLGPGRERPGQPGWTERHEVTGPEGGPIVLRWPDGDDVA